MASRLCLYIDELECADELESLRPIAACEREKEYVDIHVYIGVHYYYGDKIARMEITEINDKHLV